MPQTFAFVTRVCVVALAVHATAVRAQPAPGEAAASDAEREQQAQAQFERGSALYASHQLAPAVEAFSASYQLAPTANVAFNIAQTCELLGRLEDAFNWYQTSSTFSDSEVAARASERITALSSALAVLAVSAAPPDAALAIDGADQGSSTQSPRLVAVPPGRHHLTARRAGFVLGATVVEAERGHTLPIVFALEPLPATRTVGSTASDPLGSAQADLRLHAHDARPAAPPAALERAPAARGDRDSANQSGLGDARWWGYGSATALLGVGSVLGVAAINKHADVQADPMHADEDELTRLNLAADLTVGAALLTAAVVFVLDDGFAGPKRPAAAPHDSGTLITSQPTGRRRRGRHCRRRGRRRRRRGRHGCACTRCRRGRERYGCACARCRCGRGRRRRPLQREFRRMCGAGCLRPRSELYCTSAMSRTSR